MAAVMQLAAGFEVRRNVLAGGIALLAGLGWLLNGAGTAAALLLGLSALALGFLAPTIVLVLLAFTLPFEQAREITGLGTVHTGEMLLVAVLPGAWWHIARQRAWQRPAWPVHVWFTPFLVILSLSAFLAFSPQAIKGALRWLEFILVLFLGVHLIRRGREAEMVLWALALAAALSAWQGLGQTWSGVSDQAIKLLAFTAQGEVLRATAGFGPNTLAAFLVLMLPFSLVAALFHPRAWGRIFGLLGSGLMLAGFFATFSVIGWLALAAAGGVALIPLLRISPRTVLWLAVLLIAGLTISIVLKPDILSGPFWETKFLSLGNRLDYAAVVGKLLPSAPWVGIGPGLYRFLAPLYGSGSINPIGLITHPHSLWLSLLVETGILGLAAFLYAIVRLGRALALPGRSLRPGWDWALVWALRAGLLGFVAANFSEHCLIHDRGMHVALVLAAALVLVRRPPGPGRASGRAPFEAVWEQEPKRPWKKILAERQAGRAALYSLLQRALAGKPRARVLEVGCGPAWDALYLAQDRKYEVHALDSSARALQLARRAARESRRSLFFHQADVRRAPFVDNSFDLVFSQGLLEHFAQSQPVWAEMNRLLKPGGFCVVDVPQTFNPYTAIKQWHRVKGDWPWGWETQYTLGDLKSAGAAEGLTLVAARGYGYRGGPADATLWIKERLEPRFPQAWAWLEAQTGAWWMMNVVALFQKPGTTKEKTKKKITKSTKIKARTRSERGFK